MLKNKNRIRRLCFSTLSPVDPTEFVFHNGCFVQDLSCLFLSDETNAVLRQFIGGRESFLVFEYQISETEYLLAQDL